MAAPKLSTVRWFGTAQDWAGLYVNGLLKWQGHPGDFETLRWVELLNRPKADDFAAFDSWLSDEELERLGPARRPFPDTEQELRDMLERVS